MLVASWLLMLWWLSLVSLVWWGLVLVGVSAMLLSVMICSFALHSGCSSAGRVAALLLLLIAYTHGPPYEQRLIGMVHFGGLLVRSGLSRVSLSLLVY